MYWVRDWKSKHWMCVNGQPSKLVLWYSKSVRHCLQLYIRDGLLISRALWGNVLAVGSAVRPVHWTEAAVGCATDNLVEWRIGGAKA